MPFLWFQTNNFIKIILNKLVMEKSVMLVFAIALSISGCIVSETNDGGKTAAERLAEGNYDDTVSDHMVPSDYNNLVRNIDALIGSGNMVGARHYDELEASVDTLEGTGADVSMLREKLAKLSVAPRQGEGADYKDFVSETEGFHIQQKEDFEHEDTGTSEIEHAKTDEDIQEPDKDFRKNSEIPADGERGTLPDCDNKFFTTAPVDLSDVEEITPLGNLGPPGHTFPTDHTFLHIGKYEDNKAFPLFAPADVHITMVSWGKGFTQDPIDYTIYFALCKDIIGYYNHVKSTSQELKRLTDEVECEDFSVQAEDSCTKILLGKIEEGTLLGEVGWKQGNFDFGLIDLRKELSFANPKRHPTRTRFIHCAYDYYREDLQKQFFDLIKRDDEQQCGVTMQDIQGTLKGTWFHETAEEEYVVDWEVYLAFVNDNNFPEVQVVSIAGIFTDPGKFKFIPKSSGKINREFSQVTPDGSIYCYEASNVGKPFEAVPSGKILVQMTTDKELMIEHQAGRCSGNFNFNDPEIYKR
jgi:hypothetical protein